MLTNEIWTVPAVSRTFDRAVEDFFGDYLLGRGIRREKGEYLPALDVWELENDYGVELDVPGFTMDRLEVTVHGNELFIVGAKAAGAHLSGSDEACKKEGVEVPKGRSCDHTRQYRHRERAALSFRRQINLPTAVDPSGVSAELKDGVLTIILPKAEQARAKKIQVKCIDH